MAIFAVIGALDKITGNHLKLGDEFEKGLHTLGPLSLSMLGMMTIAPALADLLLPVITPVAKLFGFDPSALAGILIANDMGGAPLAMELAKTEEAGYFNGLVVGSMMGATISFSLPLSLGVTAPDDYTLVIKLSEPCSDMLERLTESVFMPCNEDFFSMMNGRYGLTHRHILCNGPFYISAWSKEDSLSIRKNKYYSGSQEVSPSSVNFDFRFDPATAPGKISSASLSAAMLPPDSPLPENSTTVKENQNSVFGFIFNCNDPCLKNINARLALCNSVDRSIFAQEINGAVPMSGFVPMSCSIGSGNYRSTVGDRTPHININSTAAQAYWHTALAELDKSRIEITVLCPEWLDTAVRRQLQVWQQTLGISLGITVESKTPDEIQAAVNSGNFQIALAGIESAYDSAVDFLASLRNGNSMKFNSDDYNTIIDRLLTVEDENDLLGGCYTAENHILQQGYCYPLFCRSSRFVVHEEIEGITVGKSESSISFIGTKRYD